MAKARKARRLNQEARASAAAADEHAIITKDTQGPPLNKPKLQT